MGRIDEIDDSGIERSKKQAAVLLPEPFPPVSLSECSIGGKRATQNTPSLVLTRGGTGAKTIDFPAA